MSESTTERTRFNHLVSAALLLGFISSTALAQTTQPAPEPGKPPAEAPPFVEPPKPAAPPSLSITAGDMTMKFGLLLQAQGDWTQDGASGIYAQNIFVRRIRFNVSGQVTKKVFYFFQTENSNLGKAVAAGGKTISSGFQVLDALVEWRIAKEFNLWGGLIYLPTSRDALKSSATEFEIDLSTYAFTATAALGGTAGRDTGFMARGYFADDRLEYRVGAFSGQRDTGSHNSFRYIGRLQYDVFDKEVYNLPSYPGSYLGTKKILAIGAAFDGQDNYRGFTADANLDLPTSFGSFIGQTGFQHLDGASFSPVALQKSNIYDVEAGVYLKRIKLGPWVRFETRIFADVNGVDPLKDEERFLGGLNYYVKGHNLNLKAAYGRIRPDKGNSFNQFTVQLQGYF
jgi:hypothetical protein